MIVSRKSREDRHSGIMSPSATSSWYRGFFGSRCSFRLWSTCTCSTSPRQRANRP